MDYFNFYMSVSLSPGIGEIVENTKKIREISKNILCFLPFQEFSCLSSENVFELQLWPKQRDTFQSKYETVDKKYFFLHQFHRNLSCNFLCIFSYISNCRWQTNWNVEKRNNPFGIFGNLISKCNRLSDILAPKSILGMLYSLR